MSFHWISPYREDKDLGKGINEAVNLLVRKDDDWIIHCDHDVMWLLPESKTNFMAVLNETDCDIVGCMTNRLGVKEQVVATMRDDLKISHHIYQAYVQQSYGSKVVETRRGVAAMVMAFRYSTFKTLGGFYEGIFNTDLLFCQSAMRAGMKLGIAKGVYVFHLYRMPAEKCKIQTPTYFG